MDRTTKSERKKYANLFYQYLHNGSVQKAAIVVQRQDSKSNPNIHRVQFVTAYVNSPASNVVIAESTQGVAGCFQELISNIFGNIPQKDYFDDNFKTWLRKECHMNIIWNDGLVIMIEYKR